MPKTTNLKRNRETAGLDEFLGGTGDLRQAAEELPDVDPPKAFDSRLIEAVPPLVVLNTSQTGNGHPTEADEARIEAGGQRRSGGHPLRAWRGGG